MNSQSSRIKARRKELNLTQTELAMRVGVSRVAISQWETNPSIQLSAKHVDAIAKILKTSTNWILRGKNDSYSYPTTESTSEFQVQDRYNNTFTAIPKANANDLRIPVLALSASAGHGALALSEDTSAFMDIPREILRVIGIEASSNLRIISIRGDSMLGTLSDGDLAIVDTSVREMQEDGVYIFQLDGMVHVKRLQHLPGNRLRVISDNHLYESYEVNDTHNFQICARFLGRWAFGKM